MVITEWFLLERSNWNHKIRAQFSDSMSYFSILKRQSTVIK